MGEPKVELIEQNVANNVEDIRELKKKVGHIERDVADLKADHQLTKQSITHVMETLTDLKSSIKELDDKFDKNTIDQLQTIKGFLWKFGGGLTVSIIGGMVTAILLI